VGEATLTEAGYDVKFEQFNRIKPK